METAALISKLNKAVPGAVLQKARFGRGGKHAIWIEARSIAAVAEALSSDPELRLDWLENLSVAQLDEALLLTYFVRSRQTEVVAVLRATLALKSEDELVDAPSVRTVWPMAVPFEREASELFGIRFGKGKRETGILPKGWRGFPLRKSYVFPQEFFQIAHSRPSPVGTSDGGSRDA
ncbi:MAG: NADH-quinone oxidoreductase subunit C [Oligoflexia bacterium]|nr:NADH-quinone oxidoreductase subunit C [Oligoflexia bacterium]